MTTTLRAYAIAFALLPVATFAQDPANWKRLYRPDMVCLPLEDFHVIAAKRAVADQLSRERAWVLLQQKKAIELLQLDIAKCDAINKDLKILLAERDQDMAEVVDANIALQEKNGKLKGWATVGKVATFTLSFAIVGLTINALAP